MPSSIILVRSCPARPTNGTPCRSSSAPGASPMNMIRASGEPSEKTVCLRVLHRRHVTQEETVFAKDFSSRAEARRAAAKRGIGRFSSREDGASGLRGRCVSAAPRPRPIHLQRNLLFVLFDAQAGSQVKLRHAEVAVVGEGFPQRVGAGAGPRGDHPEITRSEAGRRPESLPRPVRATRAASARGRRSLPRARCA